MRAVLMMALVSMAVGCVPKQAPVTLDTAEPIRVAMVWDAAGPGDPGAVSEAFRDSVVAELESRNLQVEVLDASEFASEFGRRRATGQRLSWLRPEPTDHVLLIETQTGFYDQINGLFRWTVAVKATMVAPGEDFPVDVSFEVPVFLQFNHQRDAEAMDAAKDVARKRVGRLADTVLRAGDGSVDARPARGGLPRDGPDAEPTRRGAAVGPGDDDLGPVYFVLVDRFHNGDPSNDGDANPSDPQAFHGGDLRGVIDRLDHIQSLGVETVWLSPVFRMRTAKISEWGAYHGYWPTGEDGVDPRFGTDADLIELSDALHDRGMKLLLDVVLNHVGYDVPMVADKPGWFHGQGRVEDWEDPVQATHFDVHGLPDLNHENPEVVAWIDGRVDGWIERYRPDGFRLDAVRHIPVAYWRTLTDRLRASSGDDFILLGELFEGDPSKLSAAWRQAGFTHMFDFPLYYALTDVLCDGAPTGRLASMLAQDTLYDDPTKLVTFLDNHDLPRIQSRCEDGGEHLASLALLRGQPAIYQGTEFAQDGAEEPANRQSIDWDAALQVDIAAALRPRATLGLGQGSSQVVSLSEAEVSVVTSQGQAGAMVVVQLDGDDVAVKNTSGRFFTPVAERLAGRLNITADGEGVRLVGAGSLLGRWNPDNGIAGRHAGGNTVFQFDVPGGSVLEYKLVRRTDDGSWEWESRGNRYLYVDGDASVEHTWGQ